MDAEQKKNLKQLIMRLSQLDEDKQAYVVYIAEQLASNRDAEKCPNSWTL